MATDNTEKQRARRKATEDTRRVMDLEISELPDKILVRNDDFVLGVAVCLFVMKKRHASDYYLTAKNRLEENMKG